MAVFEEKIYVKTSDGLKLEARLAYVPDREPAGAAVVCPPHPLYGGDMDNNVVTAVAQALAEKSLMVIRFNYRGVGASECERPDLPIVEYWGGLEDSGDYAPAIRDGEAAVEEAVRLGGPVWIVGYSLGSVVGLRAAGRMGDAPAGFAGIAAPLHEEDFSSLKALAKYLVVLGGDDELFPTGETKAAFECIGGNGVLKVVEGSDHFFIGAEKQVTDAVASFVA